MPTTPSRRGTRLASRSCHRRCGAFGVSQSFRDCDDAPGGTPDGCCCIGRPGSRWRDWRDENAPIPSCLPNAAFRVRWLSVPARGHHPGRPLVLAVRPVLPGCRGTPVGTRHRGRPREHLPMGPAVRPGVRGRGSTSTARRRRLLVRGRGLGLGRGDRPHRHGIGHDHPAGMPLQDPGDGQSPPVASRTT